jgi:hypothetical protein
MPSLHNPTAITMPEPRRRALATIARRHNVLILEDDVYAPLLEDARPPFATLEPELTVHIAGLSEMRGAGPAHRLRADAARARGRCGRRIAGRLLEHLPALGADRDHAA